MQNILLAIILSCNALFPVNDVSASDDQKLISDPMTISDSSGFVVAIPKTVELGNDQKSNFTVKAKGELPFKKVTVSAATSTITMKRNKDADYTGSASLNFKGEWEDQDLTADYSDKTGTIDFAETKAGSYSGVTTFNVVVSDLPKDLINTYDVGEVANTVFVNHYKNGDLEIYGSGTISGTRLSSVWEKVGLNIKRVKSIKILDVINAPKDSSYLFSFFTHLETADLNNLRTSNTTKMTRFLSENPLLKTVKMDNFDTSNVEDFSFMLAGDTSLSSVKFTFDVSKGAIMNGMFTKSGIETFDFANLKNWGNMLYMMGSFFENCTQLKRIVFRGMDEANGHRFMMNQFIKGCTALPEVEIYEVLPVSNMNNFAEGCTNLISFVMTSINQDSIFYIKYGFKDCINLMTLDLSNWKFGTYDKIDKTGMLDNCPADPPKWF